MKDHLTPRIGQQREDVLFCMSGEAWKTFEEIQKQIKWQFDRLHSEASISARLRDFRKVKYGAYTVNRRKRSAHLYEYRIETPKPRIAEQVALFQEAHCE